jgi:hypothetical protein
MANFLQTRGADGDGRLPGLVYDSALRDARISAGMQHLSFD